MQRPRGALILVASGGEDGAFVLVGEEQRAFGAPEPPPDVGLT